MYTHTHAYMYLEYPASYQVKTISLLAPFFMVQFYFIFYFEYSPVKAFDKPIKLIIQIKVMFAKLGLSTSILGCVRFSVVLDVYLYAFHTMRFNVRQRALMRHFIQLILT